MRDNKPWSRALQNPSRTNKTIPVYIIVRLLNTRDRILKVAERKKALQGKSNKTEH